MGYSWNDFENDNPTLFGKNKKNADDAIGKEADNVQHQYDANSGVVGGMKKSDDSFSSDMATDATQYTSSMDHSYNDWKTQSQQLKTQASDQANNAARVYTNTVQPNLQSIMENAKSEAGNAMTLKDSMDPNNSVQTAYRGMYENQAQGVNREGLADAGVLQAMGTQATMGQLGTGAPMTGGQLMALQGANTGQASTAVANAQAYAQKLREQGITTGIDQSNLAYDRGQQAKDRYTSSVNNIQTSQQSQDASQRDFRNEQSNYNDAIRNGDYGNAGMHYQINGGLDAMRHDLATQQGNRDIGLNNARYGGQNAVLASQVGVDMASDASSKAMLGGVVGGVMGTVGAMAAPKPTATAPAAAAPAAGGVGSYLTGDTQPYGGGGSYQTSSNGYQYGSGTGDQNRYTYPVRPAA